MYYPSHLNQSAVITDRASFQTPLKYNARFVLNPLKTRVILEQDVFSRKLILLSISYVAMSYTFNRFPLKRTLLKISLHTTLWGRVNT